TTSSRLPPPPTTTFGEIELITGSVETKGLPLVRAPGEKGWPGAALLWPTNGPVMSGLRVEDSRALLEVYVTVATTVAVVSLTVIVSPVLLSARPEPPT